eukprot:Rhum_TRINITY_DN7970_c0_g1::Rhum_TRINITY_DN7970_c0_g1_i1::g.25449::m.25449
MWTCFALRLEPSSGTRLILACGIAGGRAGQGKRGALGKVGRGGVARDDCRRTRGIRRRWLLLRPAASRTLRPRRVRAPAPPPAALRVVVVVVVVCVLVRLAGRLQLLQRRCQQLPQVVHLLLRLRLCAREAAHLCRDGAHLPADGADLLLHLQDVVRLPVDQQPHAFLQSLDRRLHVRHLLRLARNSNGRRSIQRRLRRQGVQRLRRRRVQLRRLLRRLPRTVVEAATACRRAVRTVFEATAASRRAVRTLVEAATASRRAVRAHVLLRCLVFRVALGGPTCFPGVAVLRRLAGSQAGPHVIAGGTAHHALCSLPPSPVVATPAEAPMKYRYCSF